MNANQKDKWCREDNKNNILNRQTNVTFGQQVFRFQIAKSFKTFTFEVSKWADLPTSQDYSVWSEPARYRSATYVFN